MSALSGIKIALDFSANADTMKRVVGDLSSKNQKFFNDMEEHLARIDQGFQVLGSSSGEWQEHLAQQVPKTFKDMGERSLAFKIAFQGIADDTLSSLQGINAGMQDFLGKGFEKLGDNGEQVLKDFQDTLKKLGTEDLHMLNTSLEDFKKNMGSFNEKQLAEFTEIIKKIPEEGADGIKNLNKQMDALNKSAENTNNALKNTLSSFKSWVKSSLRLYGVVSIFQEIFAVQTEMAHSIFNMGAAYENTKMSKYLDTATSSSRGLSKAVRQTTGEFLTMNRAIANKVNVSLSESAATMQELMSLRVGQVGGEFEDLAGTSMLMQKALGLSSGAANRFIHSLSVIGGVGAADVKNAAQAMLDVKLNLGLTEAEAQVVGDTVGKLMRQFRTFGGSASDVAVVTKEVGKMAAVFTSVGLAADEAGSILQDMMKPENLQKSIMMWNQMGISAQEGIAMMHGEGANMAGMTEKMVKAAKSLKDQYGGNVWALKAMAEAHGMSLEQVQALSQYNEEDLKNMTEKAKLEEASLAARQGLLDQLKRMKDSLMIILQGTLLPILQIIGPVFEAVAAGLQGINTGIENLGEMNKAIAWVSRLMLSLILLSSLGIIPLKFNIFSLLKTFGSFIGRITGLNKVFGKMGGLFKKTTSASKEMGKGAGNAIKNIGKGFKSWPSPKKLLAIGAAMFMMAAGVALIIFSVTELVKAVDKGNLAFSQLAGIALILVPIFAGFMGIMYLFPPIITAIGKAATKVIPGLLAAGLAFLMIGVGIGLAAYGISFLIASFKGLTDGQINAALLSLSLTMVVLIAAIVILASVGAAAVLPMLALGGAFVLIGLGVLAAAYGISLMVTSFASLGENAGMVAAGITNIILAISQLILSAAVLVGTVAIMSAAFALVSVSAVAFFGAMLMLMTTIPMLYSLGNAAYGAGEAILNMGVGMEMISQYAESAKTKLADIRTELKSGWKGAADEAVIEISRIAEALYAVQSISLGSMAANVISNIVGKASGEGDARKSVQGVDYTSDLKTANTYLNNIAKNTSDTNVLLRELIVVTKKKVVSRKTSLTMNVGG